MDPEIESLGSTRFCQIYVEDPITRDSSIKILRDLLKEKVLFI